MKNRIFNINFSGLLLLLVLAGFVTSTQASEDILEPEQDLRFGSLVVGPSGGDVMIDPATGQRIFRGDVFATSGMFGAAEFVIYGSPGARFSANVSRQVRLKNAMNNRVRAKLKLYPGKHGKIGPNGEAVIYIGGALELHGGQASGTYTDHFRLHVVVHDGED